MQHQVILPVLTTQINKNMIEQITFKLNEAEYELYMQIENNYIIEAQERFNTVRIYNEIINQLSSICNDNQYKEPQLMLSKFQDILKINDLLSVTFLDTITNCRDCILSNDNEWYNKFHGKQSYLLIYEFFITYNKHNTCINNIISNDFINLLDDQRQSLYNKIRLFKKKHKIENIGKKIRNDIAAHFNPDFNSYNKTLNYLDRDEIIAMLSDFLEIIQEMQAFFFKLLDLYSKNLDNKISNLKNNITTFKENYKDVITLEKNLILDSMIKQL